MTQDHPITPPPELVQKWWDTCTDSFPEPGEDEDWIAIDDFRNNLLATQAARRGSDQELEACCEWLLAHRWEANAGLLRAARRPKPPSLKEQALAEITRISIDPEAGVLASSLDTIRRALEALPND